MDFHLPLATYQAKYPGKYAALYHALRDEIVRGVLEKDVKLPSSRELAAMYGISRGTVNQVYDMLLAEGYLQALRGKGTYVAYRADKREYKEDAGEPVVLSNWANRLLANSDDRGAGIRRYRKEQAEAAGKLISFELGQPDHEHFPSELWNRCLYEQVRRMAVFPLEDEFAAEGHPALREAIAQHLRRVRGIDASAERIVIVNGSMQAIALLAQLLVEPGDPVIVERPGYPGIGRAIEAAGGVPVPVQVDGHGVVPQPWDSRLLFVTPSRQFPTGAVLDLDRRQQLLRWAAERGAVIVEDDYDSEFRHRGRPMEPLQVLDREGRVVYLGTFSKTMPQHLRIGYAVLPDSLHGAFAAAKRLFEPHPSGLLEQRALAAFMASGGYERHLRRMRRVYAGKFLQLQTLLQEQLSTLFEWVESDAGLHLFGWWRGDARTYAAYAAACREAGVTWSDADRYGMPPGLAGACLGFAHLTEGEMQLGVSRMKQAGDRLQADFS
ncbi:MocR-like pyridoxine biosynthesis transcription factor PdxR [Paenibacillus hexagrammi]|uniref:PLP-dependent aminotransferase family protein n=1 Tax=Paenibacillus hexagrammi TaxID=2908839 RepID=A0ABY3SDQ7_9BACL|nr:PLP-dependent aminotransferase family protein [Paenibacillus sp. YPD9-1]UJF32123.1 PLP-dependent aminotransferase family protein [Paenibacillus sp. YPD9-1]